MTEVTSHAWTPDRIGDLTGRRAVVTGGTSGVGSWVVLELARHGAEVVVAARSSERYRALERRVRDDVPSARLGYVPMDLASLSSVREGAEWASGEWDGFDLLVNNAGVMAAPERRTAEGFELHLAVNHLAHFLLTARLWPRLAERDGRVVTVSSLYHQLVGGLDLDDLAVGGSRGRRARRYRRQRAYAESKLANLLFAFELQRRLDAVGSRATSMAAHPGYASTNLFTSGPSLGRPGPWSLGLAQISRVLGQPAEMGAWPVLMAATSPGLAGGSFVGPSRQGGLRGHPQLVAPSRVAQDLALADALWTASEAATGTRFRPAS